MNSLSSGEVELNDIYLFVIYCAMLWYAMIYGVLVLEEDLEEEGSEVGKES